MEAAASSNESPVIQILAEYDPLCVLDVETARLGTYFSELRSWEWPEPSGCPGWSRKDLLGHLWGVESYTEACLSGTLDTYRDELIHEAGSRHTNATNEVHIRRSRRLALPVLLQQWRVLAMGNRSDFKKRPRQARLCNSTGWSTVELQSFGLAMELATHADDLGAPVFINEHAERVRWRASFCRAALAARRGIASKECSDGKIEIFDERQIELSSQELIDIVEGRLRQDSWVPQDVRSALRLVP